MLRKSLIVVNYVAVIVIIWVTLIGVSIIRGRGFEYHFWLSMVSLVLTMIGHVGSSAFFIIKKNTEKVRFLLILLNYTAIVFYLWQTYAGFMIRQGVPFPFHFRIAIISFFLSIGAHVLSSIYMTTKYR